MGFASASKQICLLLLLFVFVNRIVQAQSCPPNIDFENGTFTNWKTYSGGVTGINGVNTISLFETSPEAGRHDIFSRSQHAGLLDYFGNFPVVCPNGSGYSVKLGNTSGGAQAEGVSYEFTIPADRNEYSITYYYAVVFEGPNHQDFQQPRLEIEVLNATDNKRIDCSSFTFISYGSGLPGFQISPFQNSNSAIVLYKEWTPVTINLNGMAGKKIVLFFKTADCTFVRHFGYAYIDVNTGCNGEFPGAAFCPNDNLVQLTAPFGFESYRWFTSDFSRVLGTGNELTLAPAPSSGTVLAVEVTPYAGFGCKDTIYTRLLDTLTVKANAGADGTYCGKLPVIIGEPPRAGVKYSWSPTQGLSDPLSSSPLATPGQTTTYVLTASSNGGGCRATDTVVVFARLPDTSLNYAGKLVYCSTSADSAVLFTANGVITQWYRNGAVLPGATRNRLRVTSSGNYYAEVKNDEGCVLTTRTINVTVEIPEASIRYPVRYAFTDKTIELKARDIGVTALWQPPQNLSNRNSFTPDFTASRTGDFLYTVRIVSEGGCVAVDTQLVKVITKVEVFVPNAFTPNSDGLNDFLFPATIGIEQIQFFSIYDRYGQQVYNWNNGKKGWDGTFKSLPQEPGVYTWHFNGTGIDGLHYYRKGIVVLIR
jgi:gliding motility-associated-like protein